MPGTGPHQHPAAVRRLRRRRRRPAGRLRAPEGPPRSAPALRGPGALRRRRRASRRPGVIASRLALSGWPPAAEPVKIRTRPGLTDTSKGDRNRHPGPLADDDVLLREGLASLLERSGFVVAGQCG